MNIWQSIKDSWNAIENTTTEFTDIFIKFQMKINICLRRNSVKNVWQMAGGWVGREHCVNLPNASGKLAKCDFMAKWQPVEVSQNKKHGQYIVVTRSVTVLLNVFINRLT